MGDAARTAPAPPGLYCPHCDASLPASWARGQAGRCPTCLLVVGADRATTRRGGGIALSGAGTAAGMLARAAREQGATAGDEAAVAAALRRAATTLGVEVTRLRMLDYQHLAEREPELPSLGVVLATHANWRVARERAR